MSERQPLLDEREQDQDAEAQRTEYREINGNRNAVWSVGITLIIVAGIAIVYTAVQSGRTSRQAPVPDWRTLPGPQPGLRNPSYTARGRHGAVATEVNVCSQVGVDVLAEGGTATDAAIAAAYCVGVTNSFASGIGGGGFMVIRPSDKEVLAGKEALAIDFRETGQAKSHKTMYYKNAALALFGGQSVATPGELRGFEAAYRELGGGVSWKRLFEPAIAIAKDYRASKEIQRRLDYFGAFMLDDPIWAEIYAPEGHLVREGDAIRRPKLAKTLETLAKHGADAFYEGPIAEAIVNTVQAAGGHLSLEDLRDYRALVQPALTGTYLNRTVLHGYAPSAGPVLMHLLNIIEPLNLREQERTPLNLHRFVEALKFAFAARTSLGDPAFVNNEERWRQIASKEYAHSLLNRISDNHTHTIDFYGPEFDISESHGTTHISVVANDGSAAAITTTVNLIWGSRLMDSETGIILNDEADDFATTNQPNAFGLRPSPYNYPAPGKRPLSSCAPAIIHDPATNELIAIGGSGGSRIFGAVAQVLLDLDWGYDPTHAVEQPRLHDQLLPAYVSIESGMETDIIEGLRARGHNISLFDINVGVAEVQMAMRTRQEWFVGASDSRKNGVPAAY